MPGPRARQQPRPARDEALATSWIAALDRGVTAGEVSEAVAGLAPHAAAAGLRALGTVGGEGAVALLVAIAERGDARLSPLAAEALGDVRSAAAARALDTLAHDARERGVQKAARRALSRLASLGIRPAPAPPTTATVGGLGPATLYRVVASAYDGSGTRSIWFGAERPLGGIYLVAVVLNDVDGLTDCVGRDTTRKRFAEQEAELRERDPSAWVELPPEYGRQLVQEGADLARATGRLLPSSYATWSDLVDRPAEPFERALIYREISAFEVRMHPTLEGETPRLFQQPEIEPWFFLPEQTAKWLQQLARPAASRLLITPETDAERTARVLREAAKDLLRPPVLAGLKRRLEETAYIFLRTGREADARRAVQAAATIGDERPLRPPHPFVQALIERSLHIALKVERSGYEPTRLARAPALS